VGAILLAPAGATGGPRLDMAFAHADHRAQNCITCHHNFADDAGDGLCIDCHVRRAELRPLLETHFHELCRGCHVQQRREGASAGPVRRCRDCHHTEAAP
jgi:hypothetical protein